MVLSQGRCTLDVRCCCFVWFFFFWLEALAKYPFSHFRPANISAGCLPSPSEWRQLLITTSAGSRPSSFLFKVFFFFLNYLLLSKQLQLFEEYNPAVPTRSCPPHSMGNISAGHQSHQWLSPWGSPTQEQCLDFHHNFLQHIWCSELVGKSSISTNTSEEPGGCWDLEVMLFAWEEKELFCLVCVAARCPDGHGRRRGEKPWS